MVPRADCEAQLQDDDSRMLGAAKQRSPDPEAREYYHIECKSAEVEEELLCRSVGGGEGGVVKRENVEVRDRNAPVAWSKQGMLGESTADCGGQAPRGCRNRADGAINESSWMLTVSSGWIRRSMACGSRGVGYEGRERCRVEGVLCWRGHSWQEPSEKLPSLALVGRTRIPTKLSPFVSSHAPG